MLPRIAPAQHSCIACSNAAAGRLSGELPATAAAAYLSGLLIASDIAGALRVVRERLFVRARCVLIGSPQLTQLLRERMRHALDLHADRRSMGPARRSRDWHRYYDDCT